MRARRRSPGQSLVEILVATVVMSVTALLFSGSSATYRAMQDYARDQSIYQGLARERMERLLREQPSQLLGGLAAEMDAVALPLARSGAALAAAGEGQNAVDISTISGMPIARTTAAPGDLLLDLMRLSAAAAATKVQPIDAPRPRYILYKYQVTILRRDDAGRDVAVYVLSAMNWDYES